MIVTDRILKRIDSYAGAAGAGGHVFASSQTCAACVEAKRARQGWTRVLIPGGLQEGIRRLPYGPETTE
jgi:hypothetical protein